MSNELKSNLSLVADRLWWIEDKKLLQDFLEDIMTPKELSDLKDRIELIRMLNQWKTQRNIAEELGISITTVNRGSRILQWWTWAAKKILK